MAKAYARAPVVTVNGSNEGFDGFRIGVAGFDNPMRDVGSEETIRQINQGFKLKMDDMGNILIKRLAKSPVYARKTLEVTKVVVMCMHLAKRSLRVLHDICFVCLKCSNIFMLHEDLFQESALSNDIIKLANGLLEFEKPFKLFDMKKFQQNVNRELKRQYPDRR